MTQLYLTMPQPGETITEGTIVEWKVKPGEDIQENHAVAELETEKAVFEYESPFEGKIVQILHGDGVRVKVAEPIAVMDVADDKAETYLMMGIAKRVDGEAVSEIQTKPSVAKENKAPVVKADPVAMGDIKMSPYVRRLVREKGLDAAALQSLSIKNGGRITKEAIDNYAGESSTVPASSAAEEYRIETCSAIRMRIADNMVKSKAKIPHAHNGISVDVTHVVAFRDQNKSTFKSKNGTNLNFLSLIYPALVQAIQKYPVINASYDDSKTPHEIKYFNRIHLGVAAGTEHGLMIPVIHNMDRLDFSQFNSGLNDKLSKAAQKKLMPDDLMGATLIFNNYGFFGTNLGVQVIQYPMAATLGMSAIEKRVVPVGEAIGVRTMCDFVLSFDHRVMDGRETGLFLKELKEGVEALSFDHVTL